MPILYIGNPTRQTQRVYYRLNFTREGELIIGAKHMAAKWHDVPAGRQVPLGNADLPIQSINDIVNQLNEFGMVAVVDVQRGDLPRNRAVPYIFNIDAAIPASVIQRVHDHNKGVLRDAGRDMRQKAAIAGSEIIAQATGEEQQVFELEIEQEGETDDETPAVAEGYRVVPDPGEPKRRGRPPNPR